MPGPPTKPIDSVVAIKDGKVSVFADKLWGVMGLEWIDGTLYVVHAPFLSAFTRHRRRRQGRPARRPDDGPRPQAAGVQRDQRPRRRRASGSGWTGSSTSRSATRGSPTGVGKDGTTIRVEGGGVIRIRPDGIGPGSRLDGRAEPALGGAERHRRDLHLRQRRRQQEVAEQPHAPHRRRPLRLSVPVPRPPRTAPADRRPASSAGRARRGSATTRTACPHDVSRRPLLLRLGPAGGLPLQGREGGRDVQARQEDDRFVDKGGRAPTSGRSRWPSRPTARAFYVVDWAFNGWLADGPKTGRLYR